MSPSKYILSIGVARGCVPPPPLLYPVRYGLRPWFFYMGEWYLCCEKVLSSEYQKLAIVFQKHFWQRQFLVKFVNLPKKMLWMWICSSQPTSAWLPYVIGRRKIMEDVWPGSHRTSQKWTHDLGRIYRSSKIAKTQHPQRCSWTFSTARKMPRFFVWYSLMELYLCTNNRELESILNYLSYWRENKQC